MEDSKILYEKTVFGEPASKSNSSRIIRRGRHISLIKSLKAMSYSDTFKMQVPIMPDLIDGDLRLDIEIYYHSRRPDLDESLILDLLQDRVYRNDRQVKERHSYWNLDKNNPRIFIRIYKRDLSILQFNDIR